MASKRADVVVTCDLCKQEIDTSTPFPQLIYPFTEEECRGLARALAERLPLPLGILNLNVIPVNRYHRFDFCLGCVDGFMPMLEELKKLAFRAQLSELEKKTSVGKVTKKKDEDGDDDIIEIDLNNP